MKKFIINLVYGNDSYVGEVKANSKEEAFNEIKNRLMLTDVNNLEFSEIQEGVRI